MQKNFVLTVTGPDRIGIVERVTGLLFEQGGNVELSRMARLGGEFAMLLLVAIPESRIPGLDGDLALLAADGYKVTTTPTDRSDAGTRALSGCPIASRSPGPTTKESSTRSPATFRDKGSTSSLSIRKRPLRP